MLTAAIKFLKEDNRSVLLWTAIVVRITQAIKAAIYDYSKKKNITIEGLEKPKKDID